MKRVYLLFLFYFLSQSIALANPLIIDTDAAIDDTIAVIYLSQQHDTQIKAITIAATGEAHCAPALRHLGGVFKLVNKTLPPIACGSDKPLSYHHQFSGWVRDSADTLLGMETSLPTATVKPESSAVALLEKTLDSAKQPVDILTLGPLTNIATLLSQHSDLKNKIRMIYIMGGAVNVPGSVALVEPTLKNKTAEWNLYIDPKATDIVFQAGVPITLVPLDVTDHFPVDESFYQQLAKTPHNTPAQKFIFELFQRNKQKFLTQGWFFWDPLAAVIATHESIATIKNMKIKILTDSEDVSGTTALDNKNGNMVRVCNNANVKAFYKYLLM